MAAFSSVTSRTKIKRRLFDDKILIDLTESNDEDIVEAAYEAMAMAEVFLDVEDDESRH